MRLRRVALAGLCALGLVLCAALAMAANPKRLTWSAPLSLSNEPLAAVSCPTEQLCVAGGDLGLYVASAPLDDPQSWKFVAAPPGSPAIYGVACPASTSCVAVGSSSVLSSKNPADPASWHSARLSVSGGHLGGVACASTALCVAYVEPSRNFGNAHRAPRGGTLFSSANPAGGATAWKRASIRDVPSAIACVAPSTCVLGTLDGDIMTSTHPLRGKRGWRTTHQGGAPNAEWPFYSLACASVRYCLAGEPPLGGTMVRGGLREKAGARKGYLPSSWVPADVRRAKMGTWLPTVVSTVRSQPLMNAGACSRTGVCAFAGETTDSSGRNTSDRMYVATRPAGLFNLGRKTWSSAAVPDAQLLGVSCPSAHLCVAVGATPRQPGPGGPGNEPDGRVTLGRG